MVNWNERTPLALSIDRATEVLPPIAAMVAVGGAKVTLRGVGVRVGVAVCACARVGNSITTAESTASNSRLKLMRTRPIALLSTPPPLTLMR